MLAVVVVGLCGEETSGGREIESENTEWSRWHNWAEEGIKGKSERWALVGRNRKWSGVAITGEVGTRGRGRGEHLSEYMFKKERKIKFPKYQRICISTSIYVQLYWCRDFHIAKSHNELPEKLCKDERRKWDQEVGREASIIEGFQNLISRLSKSTSKSNMTAYDT